MRKLLMLVVFVTGCALNPVVRNSPPDVRPALAKTWGGDQVRAVFDDEGMYVEWPCGEARMMSRPAPGVSDFTGTGMYTLLGGTTPDALAGVVPNRSREATFHGTIRGDVMQLDIRLADGTVKTFILTRGMEAGVALCS